MIVEMKTTKVDTVSTITLPYLALFSRLAGLICTLLGFNRSVTR